MNRKDDFMPREASLLPKGPYLVFAPYPCDEIIGMGGTIALASKENINVNIVVISNTTKRTPETWHKEICGAAKILGIKDVHFWDFVNFGDIHIDSFNEKLKKVFKELRPETVFTPNFMDYHLNRRFFSMILVNFLDSIKFSGELWCYERLKQSEVNRLIDITEVMEIKLKAINACDNLIKQNSFQEIVSSLNKLQAFNLGNKSKYAEGFWVTNTISEAIPRLIEQIDNYLGDLPRWYGSRLVSVIVRTKNRPKLLKQAFLSIKRQTYRPLEVVLVNDGGHNLDISYFKNILDDIPLHYIPLERNQGRAKAANIGIKAAKGDYICFLDDDDLFYPDHIYTLANFLDKHDFKVAYTDCKVVHYQYDGNSNKIVPSSTGFFSNEFDRDRLLVGNFIPFNSILFTKDVLLLVGGLDENFELYEDWDLLIRLSKNYPFFHIPKVTCQYNQWSSQQQINQRDKEYIVKAEQQVLKKHFDKITPSLILKLRRDKDEKEHNSLALSNNLEKIRFRLERLRHSFKRLRSQKNKEVEQKNKEIDKLYKAISARDDRIEKLLDNLRIHEETLRSKDEVLAQKEHHIHCLEKEIALMRSSVAWRLYQGFAKQREKFLPPGTHRRGLYERILKILRGQRGGLTVSFLIDKSIFIIKTQGFSYFLKRVIDKLRNNRTHARCDSALKDRYQRWIELNELWDREKATSILKQLSYKPKISIIVPVYNVEPQLLDECIRSVLDQYYENWELCLYDDASSNEETKATLQKWNGCDSRIKIAFGNKNLGIADASNKALEMSTGTFVALLDNDDLLSQDALLEVVIALNEEPNLDYIYSDEDRINVEEQGSIRRHSPFFKPDWSPHFLFNCMYTGHLSVYRKSLIEKLGGFRKEYNFSQDYDLALRVTEKTDNIKHIPKVLYHWREIPGSAAAGDKPYARKTNIAALEDAIRRRGFNAEVIEYPFANRVRFHLEHLPLISIIIPTDSEDNIFNCIDLILKNTSYPLFEILVVTNSILASKIETYYQNPKIKTVRYDGEFNFSLKCNLGAAAANGDRLLFLNDDIEITDTDNWLHELVSVSQQDGVGGVSPKLYYENDTIQYAGMVTGVRDFIGTAFHCQPKDSGFYFNMIQSEREVSILSGACMLIPKAVFETVGGFDVHNTPIMHSDVDLCFKIREAGYSLIYTPFVSLRHIGHLSLRKVNKKPYEQDKAALYLLKRWGDYLSYDPFFPPNMQYFLFEHGDVYWRLDACKQPSEFLKAKDILFVSHDFSLSGAPILMFNLAQYLRSKGIFVTVMSPVDGELRKAYQKIGIPTIVDESLTSSPLFGTKRVMAHFDLIVANTLIMWPSVYAAKEIGVPVILMVHESIAGRDLVSSDSRIAKALELADKVIFACTRNASLYKKFLKQDNWEIMPYGTKVLSSNKKYSKKSDEFIIVNIGSIEPRKGQDIFIDAVNKVTQKCNGNIKGILIGRTLNNFEGLAFSEKIKNKLQHVENIKWLGQLNHENVVSLLSSADLFVCSSRDEVFPLTILEAMSLGKAIIATDVGGVHEMIQDGKEGIIVPSEDVDSMAEAIFYLYKDHRLRQKMGEQARERFNNDFNMEAFGNRFLSLLNHFIK